MAYQRYKRGKTSSARSTSQARGWVYVISNKAMPNLVKIGYSMKDPDIRAVELNNTGSPHPYVVEYDALVIQPYRIEQNTHKLLHNKIEKKEWFRCSPEEAISALKLSAQDQIITETYKNAQRQQAENIYHLKIQEIEKAAALNLIEKDVENFLKAAENTINSRHKEALLKHFPPIKYWHHWLACSILAFFLIMVLSTKITDGNIFILSIISGALIALFSLAQHENLRQKTPCFLSLVSKRNENLSLVRHFILDCGFCKQKIRFNRAMVLTYIASAKKDYSYRCSSCKRISKLDAETAQAFSQGKTQSQK